MANRPTSRLNAGPAAHPRRNLFTGGALRRPASSSTTTTATTLLESPPDDGDSGIILRKSDGNYTTIVPSIASADNEIDAGDEEEEAEVRLSTLLKNRRQSNEAELLDLLAASLRRKVNSLEKDKWIFEEDDGSS